ncbi:hypothetical protein SAMN05216559_0618 [Halomicrobium zhouii]|uniref:DUF8173 domain-containing protein n=1 Tax=Halomicrobium zhouii TaxID=767519 RepID=A0A1I6KES0_9EURY|nr:hypothetical protein [Halomicrobium zhouii]SFR89370.1 hypothetical protein SAMN05216559_0618 [Halomicrobium zhouii]
MPSIRPIARGASALVLLAFTGLAAAQSPTPGAELGLGTTVAIRFCVALGLNLVFGGGLVLIGPRYATRMVEEIRRDPGEAFGWGLIVAIAVPIALVLVALTIIGLIITIPGLFVLTVVGIVGNAVSIVWIGAALRGRADRYGGKAAGVGALALAVPMAIPVLGNLVQTLVGFFGIGAVGRDLYREYRG